MPSLLTLAVVFAGIGGKHAATVDRQVHALLDLTTTIEEPSLSKAERLALSRHSPNARDIVQRLHASGVVAGELDGKTLRVVVYSAEGGVIDLIELPLDTNRLGKEDVESLRDAVLPDVARIGAKHHDDAPAPGPDDTAPVLGDDDDDAGAAPAPPTDDDDSGGDASPDDLDAELAAQAAAIAGMPDVETSPLRLRLAAGLGMASRTFSAPTSVRSYGAGAVPAATVGLEIEPEPHVVLGIELDRALGMTSVVGDTTAPTTMQRWQGTAALCEPMGAMRLEGLVGVGRRDFSIESTSQTRTPDNHYIYAALGGRLSAHTGRISVRGAALVEPVLAGAEATAMSLGGAHRWAIEVAGDVEVAATSHVFVDAGVGLQRFWWQWDEVSSRGEGGATDSYPSATLSLGARY